jgi:hypothetical protein
MTETTDKPREAAPVEHTVSPSGMSHGGLADVVREAYTALCGNSNCVEIRDGKWLCIRAVDLNRARDALRLLEDANHRLGLGG